MSRLVLEGTEGLWLVTHSECDKNRKGQASKAS